MTHTERMKLYKRNKKMRQFVDYVLAVFALFAFALLIDMAIVGITFQELWADISRLF